MQGIQTLLEQGSYRYEKEGLVKRWNGRLLWAVDGSRINVPDTAQTREKYSIQVNQYNEEGVVQTQASFLCDVLNEISINSSIDEIKSEKSFIFSEHEKHYSKDVIVIYDRLYADYSVAASHIKAGIDFVIRCPISNTFKKVEDFKWLYNKRWGVETYLDRLKNQLEVERFSSEKLIGIEQDFYGIVFLSTFESVLSKEDEKEITEESREKQLKYEYKINKSISYSALADHIVDLLLNLNKSPEEVVDDLSKLFKTGRTPVRPGRKFERKELTGSQRLRFHKYVKRIWA